MTTQAPGAAADKPAYAKLAKRTAIAIAVVVLITIPSVVLYLISHQAAATWATVSGILGVATVIVSGRYIAVMAAAIIAALTPVAIVAGAVPIAAAGLMAIMCLIVGRSARVGLHRVTLLVPIFMAWMILDPPLWAPAQVVDRNDQTYLLWMTIYMGVGALFPAIVLPPLLRKAQLPNPQPNSREDAAAYTVTITILTTTATYVLAQYYPGGSGAWLIATVLVLTQVGNVGTMRMSVERVIGTLLGLGLVAALLAMNVPMGALYVIGLVSMIAALVAKFGPRYWIYMAFITPTVVCLNATSSAQVKGLSAQRAEFTAVGVFLVLVGTLLTLGYTHWEQTRGSGATRDMWVLAGEPPKTG